MAVSEQLAQLAQRFEQQYADAKAANIDRYVEAKNLYEENLAQFAPGGGFGAGYEAQIQQAKKTAVGEGMQHQISAGLYGVQSTGALGQQFESKVGMPARLQLEDLRRTKYGDALKDLAGVIERREDEYPDARLIADLYLQAAGSDPGGMRVTLPSTKTAEQMYRDAMNQTGGYSGAGGGSAGTGGGVPSYGPDWLTSQMGGSRTSYSGFQAPASNTSTTTSGGGSAPTQSTADINQGWEAWFNSLSKQEMKDRHLTGAMGPGGYLSYVGRAAYQSVINQPVSGTAHGDYANRLQATQPGSVTATPDEYSQIVQRLNEQYGSPTGIQGR